MREAADLQAAEDVTALLEELAALATGAGDHQTLAGLRTWLGRQRTELARTEAVRAWMPGLQDRLRAILDAWPQPRRNVGRN